MKSYHALAWKQLKGQKLTSFLILIAIIMSTMMTTVVGQSLGILQSLREKQAGMLNGYRYATFHNLAENQKKLLASDPRISWTGDSQALGSTKLRDSGISLGLTEYAGDALTAYPGISRLKEGKPPQTANEIALSEETLKLLGYPGGIGDPITLDLSISLLRDEEPAYEYKADFILSGILENNYLGYSSGVVIGIAGEGSGKRLLPDKYRVYSSDFRTAQKSGFQHTVNDLADKLGLEEYQIQYNWIYLNALGISFDEKNTSSEGKSSGFSMMTVTSGMIGLLVLLAAGLVIYNILKIAISKRVREYGTLRATGAKRGQLYLLVTEQLLLLCGIGIPAGAILGVLFAGGITDAATRLFTPGLFMAQSTEELSSLISHNSGVKWLPLLVSALITMLFALIAAMPAARYAAKVSPTVAMSTADVRVKRNNRKSKRIRHFEAYYARLNLRRNIGRTVITILSLVMSITVFVAVQSFSSLLDASKDVGKLHLGDYAFASEKIGIPSSVMEELRSRDDVAKLFTLKYKLYSQDEEGKLDLRTDIVLKQPFETLQIVGIDAERLDALFPGMTKKQKQFFLDGKSVLIKNTIPVAFEGKTMEGTSFAPGDRLSIGDRSFDVLGNSPAVTSSNADFINGVQVIVYDKVFDEMIGGSSYTEVYLKLTEGADVQAFEQYLESISDQISDSRIISYRHTDKQLEESYQQIKLLAWGLIVFIGGIGLLNIVNTTYTNIHTRKGEIGMQRAIGMSRASLYRTFLWEGAYYGIISAVVGGLAGYVCTIFVQAAATDQLAFSAFPIESVSISALASVIACMVATCLPLRQTARSSIVESIDAVD